VSNLSTLLCYYPADLRDISEILAKQTDRNCRRKENLMQAAHTETAADRRAELPIIGSLLEQALSIQNDLARRLTAEPRSSYLKSEWREHGALLDQLVREYRRALAHHIREI
jgi:hypothetical protein